MPTKQLFFGNDQRSGDQQIAGASPLAINVVTDGAGAVRRRPGISAWSGFPSTIPNASSVLGMHAFGDDLYYVTEDRRIYKIASGAATNLSTGGGPSYLAGTGRPVFAETQFRLVIAGGAAPEKVDSTESVAERLGGSPPDSTHIIAIASRLASNDLTDSSTTDRVRYSATGNSGNETWSALGFFTAEARPDGVVALAENSNEVFIFGERTLQTFLPDANLTFGRLATINYGCGAAFSVVKGDMDFVWLSERREFVRSDGRGIEVLSDPIAKTLDDMTTVSDGRGFRWSADQFDCFCWLFPTDGRTFVYQNGGGWAQWHGWTTGAGHSVFPIQSHYYWPEENLHLVGLESGQIAKLDGAAFTDLGGVIKAEVLTGFINHETDTKKHCESIRLTFKRGLGGSTEPFVLLSWRDDHGAFCDPVRLGLGTTGDYLFHVERRSLGTYRARQWKLEFSAAVDFVLARVEETFTVGGTN